MKRIQFPRMTALFMSVLLLVQGCTAAYALEPAVSAEESAETAAIPEEETEPAGDIAEEELPKTVLEEEAPGADALPVPAIREEKTEDSVTVSVHAPEGVFAEGTKASISLLSHTEAEQVFDITFISAAGEEVQPASGKAVRVAFTLQGTSDLIGQEGKTEIGLYHTHGSQTDLIAEAASSGESVTLKAEVEHFSVFTLRSKKESAEKEAAPAKKNPDRSAVSTDLKEFLEQVVIHAPVDENGNYLVDPNHAYDVSLGFRENEDLQFVDTSEMIYELPAGIVLGTIPEQKFDLHITDEQGSAVISNNTYKVEEGKLKVSFNQDDPNFARLQALANVAFQVNISLRFQEGAGSVAFNANIVMEFAFEEHSELTIAKSVVYDKNTDTAHYTLQIGSVGKNSNVLIQDQILGTALTFNQDAAAESSVSGALDGEFDYASVENGFKYAVPEMSDGEVITIRYSASVDNDKITGNGTYEETYNRAWVKSSEVPYEYVAEAHLSGQLTFHKISKEAVALRAAEKGDMEELGWAVYVNTDHKMTIGGKTIEDRIHEKSLPYMFFNGSGIVIEVTFADGSTETRSVSWEELETESNDNGIIAWKYTAPQTDGRAAYVIRSTTFVDTSGVYGDLKVRNTVSIDGNAAEASSTIHFTGTDTLSIEKTAVQSSSSETRWQIKVHVPAAGYPNLKIVDDLPKLESWDTTYFDELQEDSLQVEGLQEGETYELRKSTSDKKRSFQLTFYQDPEKTIPGLQPAEDGKARDLIVTFKTDVHPQWLALAAANGYTYNHEHKNKASATVNAYMVNDEAAVVPRTAGIRKETTESSIVTIDGVAYPKYRYIITLENPESDSAEIQDLFDTQYLKLYEEDGLQIAGENGYEQDFNGTLSAENTAEGIRFHVSQFPKNGENFYPVYRIYYSLIVKDKAALDALNQAALENGYTLSNTAKWGELTSNTVEVVHSYDPYVDKELTQRPTAENGYTAAFKIVINPYAEDLDPASDTLTVQDVLSGNLRFLSGSLSLSPELEGVAVHYDSQTSTLTFENIPDETRVEITYQVKVLGEGNTSYSNTVKLGNYEKTVEDEAVIETSGQGSGSNPSITLVKRDQENVSAALPGAVFQLLYVHNGEEVPVKDKNGNPVTFTTGENGTVLVIGNQELYGWTLWTGRTYLVKEIQAPAGYQANPEPTYFVLSERPASQGEYDLSGDQIDIQNAPAKIDITGRKIWNDQNNQDGVRPDSITIRLLADGSEIDHKVVTAEEQWQWTFADLPEYRNGTKINYTMKEDAIADYVPEIDGYTITNTHEPGKTSVNVVKTWNDGQNQDGVRPNQIVVKLLADGTDTGKTLTLSEASGWSGTFTDLDAKANGTPIVYTVEEETPAGYESSIEGDMQTGYTITNTHTPEQVDLSGAKTWDDQENQDGLRPEQITIRLLADGREVQTKTISQDDQWRWTFAALPKYQNGVEIRYTITEDAVPEYTANIQGFDITNTHTPGKTSVHVAKAWEDYQNQDGIRPEQVLVHLLADGTDTGKTLTLSAENEWSGRFENLDQKADGQTITYSIKEETVKGYASVITGDAVQGFVLTNTHTPETIRITGRKTWNDENNQDGVRPETITVRLHADGRELLSRTVSEKENWSWTFDQLPKYKDGEEILYTITEDAVPDYIAKVDGYNITNTHTPGKTSVQVTKAWNDTANKDGIRPKAITIRLLADGKDTGKRLILNAENKWTGSFDTLDTKKNGKAIVYTITEDAVSGYSTIITGSAEKVFFVTNTHTPKGDQPSVPKNRTGQPKTSVADNPGRSIGWMLAALAGISVILLYRKKEKRE